MQSEPEHLSRGSSTRQEVVSKSSSKAQRWILRFHNPQTTTICVSINVYYNVASYYYRCPHATASVLILLHLRPHTTLCPNTTICVLTLLPIILPFIPTNYFKCPTPALLTQLFLFLSSGYECRRGICMCTYMLLCFVYAFVRVC